MPHPVEPQQVKEMLLSPPPPLVIVIVALEVSLGVMFVAAPQLPLTDTVLPSSKVML